MTRWPCFSLHRKPLGQNFCFPLIFRGNIQVGYGASWSWKSYLNSNSSMGYAQTPSIDLGCKHWLYKATLYPCLFPNEHKKFCWRNLHENETLGIYDLQLTDTTLAILFYRSGPPKPHPSTHIWHSIALDCWNFDVYTSLRYLLKRSLREALEGTGGYRQLWETELSGDQKQILGDPLSWWMNEWVDGWIRIFLLLLCLGLWTFYHLTVSLPWNTVSIDSSQG